jgi:hypothetical protein
MMVNGDPKATDLFKHTYNVLTEKLNSEVKDN